MPKDFSTVYDFIIRQGHTVEVLQPHHFRVDGKLDIFPVSQRFHFLPKNERGGYQNLRDVLREKLPTGEIVPKSGKKDTSEPVRVLITREFDSLMKYRRFLPVAIVVYGLLFIIALNFEKERPIEAAQTYIGLFSIALACVVLYLEKP